MELKTHIQDLIAKNLSNLDEDFVLQDDDNIFERGFVDSLFALKLVNFIEDRLGIELENEDLDIANFYSVNRILDFIQSKKSMG